MPDEDKTPRGDVDVSNVSAGSKHRKPYDGPPGWVFIVLNAPKKAGRGEG